MPLDEIITFQEKSGDYAFHFYHIKLRNASIILVTDHESTVPALGNIALCARTRLQDKPYVSGTVPYTNPKYEVLSKSIAEIMGKKLGGAVMLFMDVRFEPADSKGVRALKIAVNNFAKHVEEEKKKISSEE